MAQNKSPKIPDYLVYEILNKKIYYRNYKKVLSGELPVEAIRGSTIFQSLIAFKIIEFLAKNLDLKKYVVLPNEIGYFYKPKKWLNLDIAVVSKEKFGKPKGSYIKVPPEIVFEIDTKADLENFNTFFEYMEEKTKKLLDSGVKQVIWIFTSPKKIFVANQNSKRWFITDYNDDIELSINRIKLNLDKLLKEYE